MTGQVHGHRGPPLENEVDIQVHGQRRFIADCFNQAIRIFQLEPAEGDAALRFPQALGIHAEGSCLIGMERGLARVDLEAYDRRERERPPSGVSSAPLAAP